MKLGVDTNVLVQYITQDDPRQARVVDRFIDQAIASGSALRLNGVVLCELVWVLESVYEYTKEEVLSALDTAMAVQQFDVEDRDAVLLAVEDFRRGSGDFADYLIARRNDAAGCVHTVTFDRRLAASALFHVLRTARG
jgi:predicted nucleic-acid-binding protein